MDYQKNMNNALSKLKSIAWNMAQEHRIGAMELDDFNEAMDRVYRGAEYMEALMGAARINADQQNRTLEDAATREKKLRLLLEVLGMKHTGVDRWCELPLRFLTIFNANARRDGTIMYGENYFIALEYDWRWLNRMMDIDRDNYRMILRLKDAASQNPQARDKIRQVLLTIHEQSGHIAWHIKQNKPAHEIEKAIINHWYNELAKKSKSETSKTDL
jgi:hypothetical protein